MQGQYNKAAQAYLKAIEKGSYYLGYVNYAGLLVKQNKLEKAKDFLENRALPRFPYNENLENTYNYVMDKIVTD
jgi:Tfp pilus assembly protein PilF